MSNANAERAMLERALDDLQTALALYAVGQPDEAVELYANINFRLRLHYRITVRVNDLTLYMLSDTAHSSVHFNQSLTDPEAVKC